MHSRTFAPIGPRGPTEPGWPLDPLSPLSPCQINTTLLLIFFQTIFWIINFESSFWMTVWRWSRNLNMTFIHNLYIHVDCERCPLPSLQVSLYQEHRQVPWAPATQCHPADRQWNSRLVRNIRKQFIKRKRLYVMMLPFVPGLHPLLGDLVYLVTPRTPGHPDRGKSHARASVGSRLR